LSGYIAGVNMKKMFVFCVLVWFSHAMLVAQTVGPLFQVMSSGSLLNRPIVFRDMQGEIQQKVDKTTPGLQLNDFYQDMSDWRRRLIDLVTTPEFNIDSSHEHPSITIGFKGETPFDAIRIKDINSLTKNGSDLLTEAEDTLARRFNNLIDGLKINPPTTKTAVLAALILALEETGASHDVSTSGFDDSVQLKFSKLVSGILFRDLKTAILGQHPELRNQFVSLTAEKVVEFANACFSEMTEKSRQKLEVALDFGEHEVAKAVDEVSRWLVSGNAGLAVSKGEGGFGGGFQLSYVQPGWQAGIYVNGECNKGDTTKPTESLIGLRTQFAFDKVAVDILASGLFGDAKFKAFHSGELGSGLTYRPGSSIIFGVAYYLFFGDELYPQHTVGLTFKGTSSDSPGVLFGARVQTNRGENNDVSPIFQISYPIFGK
jgi:hypothetical protein